MSTKLFFEAKEINGSVFVHGIVNNNNIIILVLGGFGSTIRSFSLCTTASMCYYYFYFHKTIFILAIRNNYYIVAYDPNERIISFHDCNDPTPITLTLEKSYNNHHVDELLQWQKEVKKSMFYIIITHISCIFIDIIYSLNRYELRE